MKVFGVLYVCFISFYSTGQELHSSTRELKTETVTTVSNETTFEEKEALPSKKLKEKKKKKEKPVPSNLIEVTSPENNRKEIER